MDSQPKIRRQIDKIDSRQTYILSIYLISERKGDMSTNLFVYESTNLGIYEY
jgi:hypothetical protein